MLKVPASWLIILLTLGITSCRENTAPPATYKGVQGKTMGTYYKITYQGHLAEATMSSKVDSILHVINDDVSTYIPSAYISLINSSDDGNLDQESHGHFWPNLIRAQYWQDQSKGYLDVSTMPLVNYWGFGYTPKRPVTEQDESKVDSMMVFVGLDKWNINQVEKTIKKSDPRQQLDFSSLAKGYAVDEIGRLLTQMDITNYLIDIGGDGAASGLNAKGNSWTIGINTPLAEASLIDFIDYLRIDDVALASSGNYRNFHEVEGQKYGHTINPFTGYPYQDSLLAVSVIAATCIDADAIATTCMAMGYHKAATFIAELENVTASFFVGRADGSIVTKYADGFIRYKFDPGSGQ